MPDLESRLVRVERELRLWRLGALALAAAGAVLSCRASSSSAKWPAMIEGSLTVHDETGSVTISPHAIEIDHGGGTALLQASALALRGADAETYAMYGVSGTTIDGGGGGVLLSPSPSLQLRGPGGRASLVVQPDGSSLDLSNTGEAGGVSLTMFTKGDSAHLSMIDSRADRSANLFVADGDATVEVRGKTETQRLSTAK